MGCERVAYLDGWRGLAVLLVLVGHFSSTGWLSGFGVELFFVLSGRLMSNILLEQQQPLPTFALRRMMRILPALAVYIALVVLVGGLSGVPTAKLYRGAIASGLFISNYLVGGDLLTVFQHTWSLAVEEHSYIALAAIGAFGRRDPRRCTQIALGVALLMMAAAALRVAMRDDRWQLYLHSETRGASILVAFAIASFTQDLGSRMPTLIRQWSASVAFLAAFSLTALQLPAQVFFTFGTMLLAISVNLIDHAHPSVQRMLCDPVLTWFGLISFSLYLWQQPFYSSHPAGVSLALIIPSALILAAGSFYFVERPARRLLNRSNEIRQALT